MMSNAGDGIQLFAPENALAWQPAIAANERDAGQGAAAFLLALPGLRQATVPLSRGSSPPVEQIRCDSL
jgi:hypothetical protein